MPCLDLGSNFKMWVSIILPPYLMTSIFAMNVELLDTVLSIKIKIEKQEGIPVKDQVLTHKCRVMNNARTLGDYDVFPKDAIYLNTWPQPYTWISPEQRDLLALQ